jgi:hypothetical protein
VGKRPIGYDEDFLSRLGPQWRDEPIEGTPSWCHPTGVGCRTVDGSSKKIDESGKRVG